MSTVLKVTLGVVLGGIVLIVGCSALLSAGLDEQQTQNAISDADYRSVKKGTPRRKVEGRFGEPESADEFSDDIEGVGKLESNCLYYNLKEGEVGSFAQLCFNGRGRLESKSRSNF